VAEGEQLTHNNLGRMYMSIRKITFVLLTATVFLASNVHAVKLEGTFQATKSCSCYKSFKRGHNPGDIYSVPGRIYEVLEENKAEGPWVLIMIPEISQSRRWVSKECGILRSRNHPTPVGIGEKYGDSDACNVANTYDSNVLALSWQAGFCEHFNYSGVKSECDNLNAGTISVTNLTIHGLWPNKRSCGRSYGSCSNVALDLEESTVSQIAPWMPNFYYSTNFGNHEWKKHGTCQSLDDDEYFLLMQRLAERFDRSALGRYLRDNIGKDVQVAAMKGHLVSELGEDVSRKIELRCIGSGKRYLNELWINLPKKLDESGSLTDLVSGAGENSRFRGNCAAIIHIEAPGI
jgi:ribonuclease T2